MNLPRNDQRVSIIGKTGSGKTVAALWLFSMASWDSQPWVIYDYKRDDGIAEIEALQSEYPDLVRTIELDEVPRLPGIYIVHPFPDQQEAVEAQLWGIWEQGYTGIYVDEGLMVNNPAFRAALTQGRSKRIPMIVLSQRPVWLDRFVFSESDFYLVFYLNHVGDRRKVMEYIPAKITNQLPPYHSFYYDVGANELVVLKPVPAGEAILAKIRSRLDAMKPQKRKRLI